MKYRFLCTSPRWIRRKLRRQFFSSLVCLVSGIFSNARLQTSPEANACWLPFFARCACPGRSTSDWASTTREERQPARVGLRRGLQPCVREDARDQADERTEELSPQFSPYPPRRCAKEAILHR